MLCGRFIRIIQLYCPYSIELTIRTDTFGMQNKTQHNEKTMSGDKEQTKKGNNNQRIIVLYMTELNVMEYNEVAEYGSKVSTNQIDMLNSTDYANGVEQSMI